MAPNGSHLISQSGNLLLQGLGHDDRMLIAPHLALVQAERGATLFRGDAPLDALHFPETALLALEERIGATQVEIAIVGGEGMIGWPALLGCDRASHAAVVQMRAGTLLRIAAEPLRAACRASPTLHARLLSFVNVVMVQMTRAIASHLHDPLDHRLARWLLMRHDRVGGDALPVQHDEIAHSLNVRRASITDRLHLIEGEKLIRCNRGRILIRDRAMLEAFAGDAYGIAEAHYRATIAPFGKSPVIEGPLRQAGMASDRLELALGE